MVRLLELLLWIPAQFPWFCWDLLARVIVFFLKDIFRYRQKVIQENIDSCFPEISSEDRVRICSAFYRHLANLMVETLRSFGFPPRQVALSIQIEENEALKDILTSPRNAILVFGHYHNWEWITQGCGLFFTRAHRQHMVGFFKTIRNKTVETLMNRNRTRMGGAMYSDKQPRAVIRLLQGKEKVLLGMVADQTPPGREQMFMVRFLGRETPFFTGPGWIAAASGVPVYYGKMEKTGRHQYRIVPELLYSPEEGIPRAAIIETITLRYAARLEAQIREAPEYWLWSHRRWKYAPSARSDHQEVTQ